MIMRRSRIRIDRSMILTLMSALIALILLGVLVHRQMWHAPHQTSAAISRPENALKTPTRNEGSPERTETNPPPIRRPRPRRTFIASSVS